MSEHRRKPPQPQGGGRAAARRAAQQPSGRRGAQRGETASLPSSSYGDEGQHAGRAAARRAAARGSAGGGRRRVAETGPGRARGRAAPPGKKRLIDYPRSGKYGWQRWVPSWKQVTGTTIGFFGLLMLGATAAVAWVDVPKENKTATAQSNVFYWEDGTQMASTGGKANRQLVEYGKIPKSMKDAVIAAENATFEDDRGVDPMGIARAALNMAMGGETQGGSTITQQYVKNAMLSQEQTVSRKVTELFISIKVGATMDKPDILKGYLNTAYYGRNAYGIQAAAQAYFGKDCDKLTVEESVFLASVLKGPNLYNPDGGVGAAATPEANTERAQKRWVWILDRMVEVGRMTDEERDKVGDFPKLKKQTSTLAGQTGYLVDIAKDYVTKKTGLTADQLELGGYKIYTTFEKDKVKALTKAVDETRKDFLDAKERPKTDKWVQFGAASVDPKSGAIVALYGGDGYDKNHFSNNANTTGVPVGSTWKPYVLAAAMEYGTVKSDGQPISPESKYNGNDLVVIKNQSGDPIMGANGQPFRQKNEGTTAWGYISLTKAMEQSVNTPFVQLGIDVGLDNTRKVAENTGILESSFDTGNLTNASFSLGTSTPSAIRMADSYATFANSGTHYEPYSVTKVVDGDGNKLDNFTEPKAQTGLDADVADNVTKVLENVVKNGTAKRVADIGFPVAGKTGTTDKNKSAWFVGYTRELSTAVTLFRTDPEEGKLLSMNGTGGVASIHGGDIPAQLWEDYMSVALKDADHEPFPEAQPIGDKVDQDGASPSPSPTESEPEEEEPTEPT
ncbi:transglycosylase domain-containing protein, partial [Streptomyces sp. GC420]|uniref:transglycosylase domain-containing protein n=1 Tax=Streptomyces sp. GC420 TaxID=2697568 RepID=UPI00141502B0